MPPPPGVPIYAGRQLTPEELATRFTTSQDLAKQAGVSYRQLNFWTAKGMLRPSHCTPVTQGRAPVWQVTGGPVGSGYRLLWDSTSAAVARRMAAWVRVGLPPELASDLAHHQVLGEPLGHSPLAVLAAVDPDGPEGGLFPC